MTNEELKAIYYRISNSIPPDGCVEDLLTLYDNASDTLRELIKAEGEQDKMLRMMQSAYALGYKDGCGDREIIDRIAIKDAIFPN